ncbi:hypothetical protein P7C71_g2045, partial [Lecanoromycetidae sp. Uapishka_2]
MASSKIFLIPEILEMILVQLPERDLLLDQRVNKTWQGVIKTSPQLQRKLFFTADIIPIDTDQRVASGAKWNPLLGKVARSPIMLREHRYWLQINARLWRKHDYPTAS